MSGSARVEVFRGETVESAHRVHVAVVDGLGNVVSSAGDARFMTFLRSAAKPFQALAAVEGGAADRYGLDERELALLCGSHAGEPGHVKLAESILHKAGLSASALRCGSHAPRTKAAKDALGGARATPLHHNCSGKHAGMLLLQRHLGGEPERYLDPAGPAQRAVLAAVARVAGVPEAEVRVATDGCSAPNFALPLDRAALLFARLAMPQGVPASTAAALGRLRDAMVRHPDVVAGRALLDADL
ncbi:MAG TPA: asparaginase, partial [Candidatus Thermoplasmatota archaeon]|nr:asparaginase [Candidatus Thermoplasmatota archaeon]